MSTNLRSRLWTRHSHAFVAAVLAGAVLIAAPSTFAGDKPAKKEAPPKAKKVELVEQQLDLPEAKAKALFALLAPDNVQVRVASRDGGLMVRGTPQEIKALTRFAKILMRTHGQSEDEVRLIINNKRASWGEGKTFKMPDETADMMLRLLGFADVPVLVSRVSEGVAVDAGDDDLKTIWQVTQIAKGKRLGGPNKQQMDREAKAKAEKKRQMAEKKRQTAEKSRKKEKKEKAPTVTDRAIEHYEKIAGMKHAFEEEVHNLRRELHEHLSEVHEHAEQMHMEAQRLHEQLQHELERLREDYDRLSRIVLIPPPDAPQPERIRRSGVVREKSYVLPDHHAENLFQLLAPSDIEEVLVSRDGNRITVRGKAKDIDTIDRLVGLLTRDGDKEHAGAVSPPRPERR